MKLSQGVKYMFVATFTFALMKVCVKYLANIPVIEIILFRAVISLIICFFFLYSQKVYIFGNNKKLLIVRGLTGSTALISYFYLLHQIPLATAATLQYLSPIFATILGVFFLKEKVFKIQWLFFIISFLGILCIQGFEANITYLHLFIGIMSSIFSGIAYNLVRKLNTDEHPLVIILYFPLVLLPIASFWTYFVWVTPSFTELIFLILVGLFTQIAQFYLTKAYQKSEISKISIINYLGIIFAIIFGYYIFNETLSLGTYLGISLVILGVLLNVIVKERMKKDKSIT